MREHAWVIHYIIVQKVIQWISQMLLILLYITVLVFLKVREAQLAQYNYILVVGEEEANTGQVYLLSVFHSTNWFSFTIIIYWLIWYSGVIQ